MELKITLFDQLFSNSILHLWGCFAFSLSVVLRCVVKLVYSQVAFFKVDLKGRNAYLLEAIKSYFNDHYYTISIPKRIFSPFI